MQANELLLLTRQEWLNRRFRPKAGAKGVEVATKVKSRFDDREITMNLTKYSQDEVEPAIAATNPNPNKIKWGRMKLASQRKSDNWDRKGVRLPGGKIV